MSSSHPPPDGDHENGLAANRRNSVRLIREMVQRLGWKYLLWIPAVMLISTVHLLPPQFLMFFTSFADSSRDQPATFLFWQISPNSFIRWLVVFGILIAACQWLASVLSGLLYEFMRLTISVELRRDAVSAINRTRVDKLDTGHRGDWMTRTTSDLRNCESFLTHEIAGQIRSATIVLCIGGILFSRSVVVGMALVIAAIAMLIFNTVVQKVMAPTLGKARDIEGNIVQSMIETFEGLRTIRSFGAEEFTLKRIDVQLQNLFRTGMKIMRTMSSLMGLNGAGTQIVITAIFAFALWQFPQATPELSLIHI